MRRHSATKLWRRSPVLGVPLVLAAAAPALANGRLPSAQSIAFDPSDAAHLVVSTTFGLLESRDAGVSFTWTCEGALGLSGEEDVTVVVTHDGTVVGGTFGGVVVSTDGCSYERAPDLDGEIILDVTSSRSEPGHVIAIRTLGIGSGRFDSHLVRSEDHGATWTRIEPALPETVLPLTVDVAPSDPERVYVSGPVSAQNEYSAVLLRSDDGGETFESSPVPDTTNQRLAFISAVHPTDPDRVYVRVENAGDAARLDELLWTYNDRSFLAHQIWSGTEPTHALVKVLLGELPPPPTHRQLLVNFGGTVPEELESYERIAEIVDTDVERKRLSRERYKQYRERGCTLETHNL